MCELAPYLVKYDYSEKHGFEDLLVELYRDDDVAINNTNLVDSIDVILIDLFIWVNKIKIVYLILFW